MSINEILFRLGQYLNNIVERYFHVNKFIDVALLSEPLKLFEDYNFEHIFESEKIEIFNKYLYIYKPINWHLDLQSGIEFPKKYSKSINIRSGKLGSVKHVWEVNRMQFLPNICINYIHTKNKKYLELFTNHILSWKEQNPYLVGINWYSNIEVSLRLIIWFFCWEILNVNKIRKDFEWFDKFVNQCWIPIIYLHCLYITRNPSLYSSSNNHLIAEYSGLFIATSFWKFKESKKWNNKAKKGLEKEIIRQHSSKGINREEAAGYIQFITDFFLLSFIVGDRTNNPFSAEFKNSLNLIFCYIYHFLDGAGNYPTYGDYDDGKVILLDPSCCFNNFHSLLNSGFILFNQSKYLAKSGGLDIKTRYLFGISAEEKKKNVQLEQVELQSEFYKEEGHFFLKSEWNNIPVYIHFNAAPLGFLSISAHGHADALSFIMNVQNIPVLIDPGTYTYNTELVWRNYFKGTLAHNTIRVDHTDQAENGGPTIWHKHYQVFIEASMKDEKVDRIVAWHNGYTKLGVIHKRELHFDKKKLELIITDNLLTSNKDTHIIEIPFHISPEHKIDRLNEKSYCIHGKSYDVYIIGDYLVHSVLVQGNTEPILGWYSPSFYQKKEIPVILSKLEIRENSVFKTIINITHR